MRQQAAQVADQPDHAAQEGAQSGPAEGQRDEPGGERLRLAWRSLRQRAYLAHLGERFGRYGEAPRQPVIWVHGVSVGETRARFLCWTQQLPAPVPNWPIHDERGVEIARVDLAWPQLGVFLEFDGRSKYLEHLREGESVVDCVLREKQRESRICELTGWRCIRIVWADLYRPAEVASRIRALFRTPAA